RLERGAVLEAPPADAGERRPRTHRGGSSDPRALRRAAAEPGARSAGSAGVRVVAERGRSRRSRRRRGLRSERMAREPALGGAVPRELAARDVAVRRADRPGRVPRPRGRRHGRRRARPPADIHAPPPPRARAARDRRAHAQARRSPPRRRHPQPEAPEDHRRHGRRGRRRARGHDGARRRDAPRDAGRARHDRDRRARPARAASGGANVLGGRDRRGRRRPPPRARKGRDARLPPFAQVAHGLRPARVDPLPAQAADAGHRGRRQPELLARRADPAARRRVLHPAKVLGRPPLQRRGRRVRAPPLERRVAARVLPRGGALANGQAVAAEARAPVARGRRGPRRPDAYDLVLSHQHRLRALRRGEGLRSRDDRRREAEGERPRPRDVDAASHERDLASLTPPRRRAVITRLAYRVMNEINAVTAVTAGSLVATALLAHDKRGLPHANLVATCERLARTLRGRGARFSSSLVSADGRSDIRTVALEEAVDLFVRAGHVEAHRVGDDVIYVVPPDARLSLDLAKNVIIHFFAARALIATAVRALPGPPLAFTAVRERVLWMSRLFKYEFAFRADAPFETIFEQEIAALESEGELARVVLKPSEGATGLVPKGDDGREQIALYAHLIENAIEGYRIAARGLTALLRGPVASKDLIKRAMTGGERMFLAGEIARREAVSRPLLENAYTSFVDQGYLARDDGKLALNESYATASAVATIESRIVTATSPSP